MSLWDIIKQKREEKKLTQKELAKLVGCSPMHISVIERPYAETQRTASDELLRKLAKALSTSEAEVADLERTFLIEKTKITAPPEVIMLLDQREGVNAFCMPASFLARLKKDLEMSEKVNIYEKTGISQETIQEVLLGNQSLRRKDVITLATAFNQDVEEYLLLAGILPDNVKEFLRHGGSLSLLRSIKELSPEDIDAVIDVFNNIVDIYRKKKNKK